MQGSNDRADDDPVRLCEVGALGVRSSDSWTPLRGERVGAVVALLSIAPDSGVRTAALLDAAWPEPDRPANARQSLANVIARLRAQFGGSFIETTGSGYRLGPTVDSDRARILEVAASDEIDDADVDWGVVERVDDALGRWRGEPWVDITIEEVEPDRARLNAARLRLVRAKARSLAQQSRDAEAVDTLEQIVATGAGTEDDWYDLARAIAALGNRADAIKRIREARRSLAHRGLEIGERLASLESALLDGSWNESNSRRRTEPSSPMLGRRAQLDRVSELIDQRRLVTVTGPGGVGKTRLALELMERRPELGPVFVDLVPVRDGRFVPDAMAAALKADVEAAGSVLEAIVDELRARPRLVVLDNCEQVIDAVASVVADVVARCVDVKLLTTSREPLDAHGELVVELQPLDTGERGAAVELFFQRAVESGIDLDRALWGPTVAELCERIDGLPLAIELAARRVVLLTPDEIVAALVDRFDLLRASSPDPRHSALSTTLMWSWELLDTDEQHTLCQLAAFASGVDINELGAALGREQWEAVDAVQRLRAKSLVSVVMGPSEPSRAHLLESVRMLAIDRARDRGVWEACRAAHRRWVDEYTTRISGLHGQDDRRVEDPLSHLDREGSEIRAALEWSGDDQDRALAICARLVNWWRGRDMAPYATERFEELLHGAADVDAEVRCEAFATLVLMRRIAGLDHERTSELTAEARRLLDAVPAGPARDRLELRYYEAAFDADDHEVPDRLNANIERTRRRGDDVDTLATHLLSAWYVANSSDLARSVADDGLRLSRSTTVARQAHAWEQCGLSALVSGDLERAQHFLRGALERFEDIGQRFCAVHGCESTAWWLAAQGRFDESRTLLAAAEGLRTRHRRYRSGFEEPAAHAAFTLLGGRPDPESHAQLDATIDAARIQIGTAITISAT